MNKLKYVTGLVVLFCFMQGCYKDKGNYDYQAIGKVVIDTTVNNIRTDYAIYRNDTLRISPDVYFNGTLVTDEKTVADKLSFTWVIFQATTGGNVYSRDTLSHVIKLNEPVTKQGGKWIVHLTVKELATQVETYVRFNVDVSETLSDGWMVLYEKDGATDVGIIVDDRSKKGVVTPRLFLDLMKSSNGAALAGKPVALVHSTAALTSGEVMVTSEHDMVGVDKSSFGTLYQFADLFWTPPAGQSLKAMVVNPTRKELAINNNRIHTANYASVGTFRTNKLGPAIPGVYGELEKWSAVFYGASYDAVVYDKTNKKFKQIPVNGTSVVDFPAQATGTKFEPSNVGLDMKADDWGASFCHYSIMSNSTNAYLLISNFYNAAPAAVGVNKIDMTACPGVNAVTTLASAYAGQYLLYGSNSNVYLYKYNSGAVAEAAWSAPAGETVTCVRLQKFFHLAFMNAIIPLPNQVVYIATWNEATKTGKVYSYPIDPSNGSIDKAAERVTEGYGKVKDMSYKWSL
ncbi:hypothetical protein HNQ91_002569 [Filimonas zeae]|nr:PKD-like family lipoprotein [Filimonas zeae]MDR6339518.1 hypothetical protein [Filimonas zeae]